MSARSLLTVLLFVLLAGVAWLLLRSDRGGNEAQAELVVPGTSGGEPASEHALAALDQELLREPALASSSLVADAPPPPAPAALALGSLEVEVFDAQGQPAAEVALVVEAEIGPQLGGLDVPGLVELRCLGTSDERGRARFELPVGAYSVVARGDDGRFGRRGIGVGADGAHVRISLSARPRASEIVFRVVAKDGSPVAGAKVELFGALEDREQESFEDPPLALGVSDERGEARLPPVALAAGVALARTSDGRAGRWNLEAHEIPLLASGKPFVVRVEPAGVLEGTLLGRSAEELAGARVLAYALDRTQPYYSVRGTVVATRVEQGRYRFDGLAPGRWTLALDDPGGARLAIDAPSKPVDPVGTTNAVEPPVAEVHAGATVTRDLEVAAGAAISGVVRRADGTPVEGARVFETFAPRTSNFPDGNVEHGANVWRFDATRGSRSRHPSSHREARTDASGRYRLIGLQPGKHRLEVTFPGLSYDRREALEVAAGAETALEHVLEPAGAIRGVAPGVSRVGVVRAGERSPAMLAILPQDGRFAFGGLAPGRWTLACFHSDEKIAPVEAATAEVVAGRTAWVEIGAALPVRIGGRVVDADGPVAGAVVRLSTTRVTTDEAGRFERRSAFAWTLIPITIRVQRGEVESTFEFPKMEPGILDWERELVLGSERLRVRTLGADGSPIAAAVELRQELREPDPASGLRSATARIAVGADGEREITGLARGAFAATARFADGSESQSSGSLPAAEPFVFRAPPSVELTVRLVDASGAPRADAFVQAIVWATSAGADANASGVSVAGKEPEPPISDRGGTSGADGRVVLRGLLPGEAVVRVHAQRPGWASAPELGRQRLALRAGDRHELAIEVRDPESSR